MKISDVIKELQEIADREGGNIEVRSRTGEGFQAIDSPAVVHLWKGDRSRTWLPKDGDKVKGKRVVIV